MGMRVSDGMAFAMRLFLTGAMSPAPRQFDVIVLGAGAAGLMCAAVAGQRGGG